MVHLTFLDLGSNNFTGPIPGSISYCQKLRVLKLAKNNLGGQVPASFSEMKSLTHLSEANTSLHNIRRALSILGQCGNLTTLVLTLNFQNEEMPEDSNLQFEDLKVLLIGNCQLTGFIPTWMTRCTNLQLLDISWNQLSGTIPPSFSNLKYLFYLDLSHNLLSGKLPSELTKLQSLIYWNISLVDHSKDVTFFRKRDQTMRALQYNTIGSFPPTLALRHNRLTGPIWPAFGNLNSLHVLDLSNNNISGHIPSTLSGMAELETLDLSNNSLSGNIPLSLQNLTYLSSFSVAFNNLTGIIPSGGQFMTFPNSSFLGNAGLCGAQSFSCLVDTRDSPIGTPFRSTADEDESIIGLPFGVGIIVGFIVTVSSTYMSGWLFRSHRRESAEWQH